MMSCVADKIIASPFAVLGSIGVISEIPNVYDRLKEEGIEFQTVTAGKFKRTLTPTKKVTREDMTKSKEDIESIFQLFKGWVAQNRPQLNIEEVATGETWFGPDALERGLCDEIKTVDDVLLDYVDAGYSVYEVAYDPPPEVPSSLGFLFANEDGSPEIGSRRRAGAKTSLGRRLIQWVVQSFAEEVKAVLSDSSTMGSFSSSSSSSTKNRYMARDNSSENIRVSDEDLW
jgi:ClpP class serine protease